MSEFSFIDSIRRRVVLGTGLLFCGGFFATATYLAVAPTYDELGQQGGKLVAKIEVFRSTHGRYPLTAEEAKVVLPKTRYGVWQYRTVDDGNQFVLKVGDYDELFEPFVLFWESKNQKWYLDR